MRKLVVATSIVGGYPRLLGDWGATNLRLAYRAGPGNPLFHVTSLKGLRGPVSPVRAIRVYLNRYRLPIPPYMGIGIACPCEGDGLSMPSRNWAFSQQALRERLGARRLVFVNDGAALAFGSRAVPFQGMPRIGGGEPLPGKPIIVLSVGTGLAVSVLLLAPDGTWFDQTGFGGWMGLTAADEEEDAIVQWLRAQPECDGHVPAGLVLCGRGLTLLCQAIARDRSVSYRPAEVLAHARAGTDPVCVKALEKLFGFLANHASDLALLYGAGAVYVGGGVMHHIGVRMMKRSLFRERFEAKEVSLLGRIPVVFVPATVPMALLGAEFALERFLLAA